MTPEENDLLCRVGPGTPMGIYMRGFWTPTVRSAAVTAEGGPVRVRLFGEDYVAFRATDGRVGFIDEACPHRGASMALARVGEKGCSLVCLYHGWEVDVTGDLLDMPSDNDGRAVAEKVKLRRYGVREAGELIWVYVGDEAEEPPFPDFEWLNSPAVYPTCAIVENNWLQVIEGTVDPMHVGFLHQNWLPEIAVQMMTISKTSYELVDQPYGFTGAVIRQIPDGPVYARVKEFVLPFYGYVPFQPLERHTVIFTVPIDDGKCYTWYYHYKVADPGDNSLAAKGLQRIRESKNEAVDDVSYGVDASLTRPMNLDNFRDSMPYDPENLWGQKRAEMQPGHKNSGLPGLVLEDFAVTESQGPIADRSKERLGQSDVMVVRLRRLLMAAARAAAEGKRAPTASYAKVRARAGFLKPDQEWDDVPKYSWEIEGMNIPAPVPEIAE